MPPTTRVVAVLFLVAVGLAYQIGWAKNRHDNVAKIGKRRVAHRSHISEEKEAAIGRVCAERLEADWPLITDSRINEYIQRVGADIARNSDLKHPPTIRVIDSPEVISVTLPGDFLYVSSGMIFFLEDEGQLAGLLAHQIAHVAARHWASIQTKDTIINSAISPVDPDARQRSASRATHFRKCFPLTDGLWNAQGYGTHVLFFKTHREYEVEADYLGLQYMWKAGYDTSSFLRYLANMAAKEPNTGRNTPYVFSARPLSSVRLSNSEKEIEKLLPPPKQAVAATSEFEDMKARLERVASGPR